MSDQPTLEEFTQALEDLPPEFKAQLATAVHPAEEVDTVAIKLELVKFVTELQKHNQGVNWETNKEKPKAIRISKVIEEATELFDFLME
tara:strand:+ start:225 stop:491 length:267 start_codon:yes stop_codon:yes gene_type:complete